MAFIKIISDRYLAYRLVLDIFYTGVALVPVAGVFHQSSMPSSVPVRVRAAAVATAADGAVAVQIILRYRD